MIKNLDRLRQAIDTEDLFEGLRGIKYSGDVDNVTIINDCVFLIEVKFMHCTQSYPQWSAYHTIAAALQADGYDVYHVLAWHDDLPPESPIMLRDCIVGYAAHNGATIQYNSNNPTVKEFIRQVVKREKSVMC